MLSRRRVLVSTIAGLLSGVVSYLLARSFAPTVHIPLPGILAIILWQGVMGFSIGISAWGIRWWLHGSAMGLIFSLPCAFGAVWLGFGPPILVWALIQGIVLGFLVELVTPAVFGYSAIWMYCEAAVRTAVHMGRRQRVTP